MRKANHYLLLLTSLIFLPLLQSCNDDDSGNGPEVITYPHTITFSHIENIEFKMWTNGMEVNTDGMNFLDFVEDEEDRYKMTAEYFELSDLTFTEDSLFSLSFYDSFEGYPYFTSNDSLYVKEDFFGDVFIGIGSPVHLRFTAGFVSYSYTSSLGELTTESSESFLGQKFHTFESLQEYWNVPSLQDIKMGDTLIINNQYVHFN